MGMFDTIRWLADSQRESRRWQGKFRRLMSSLDAWQRHLREKAKPEPEGKKSRFWSRFLSLPDEILNAPDPLDEIIKLHSKEPTEDEPWPPPSLRMLSVAGVRGADSTDNRSDGAL